MTLQILVSSKKNIVFEGICSIIEKTENLQLSGMPEDTQGTLSLCEKLRPDVVVATSGLSGMTDVGRFIRDIKRVSVRSQVVLIANMPNIYTAYEVFSAGALAYISPTENPLHDFVQAIQSAANGRVYLGESIPKIHTDQSNLSLQDHFLAEHRLGDREQQVLTLLASGNTSKKIASLLHISTSTVEVHRRNIMRKTGLHNIADLTRFAIRNQLITV